MKNKWTPEKIADHLKVLTSGMCFYNVVHRASAEIIKQVQKDIWDIRHPQVHDVEEFYKND
jgi:hypothetical protein